MQDHDAKRREFLKSAVRWLALPVVGGGVAAMALRKGEKCTSDFLCSSCQSSKGCGLPQALSYRQAMEMRDKEGPNG